MAYRDPRVYERNMTSRDFSDYPNQEGDDMSHRHPGRVPFSPIQEIDEAVTEGAYPSRHDKKIMSVNREQQKPLSPKHSPHPHREQQKPLSPKHSPHPHREQQKPLSPKHSPHPHSPSSSSSGHSSPRSPPSHPPPSSLPTSRSAPTFSSATATNKQQRTPLHPHSSPSHIPRNKSHDIQHGYHGDPNKVGSNWKSSPSMSRGHSRTSSDPKKYDIASLMAISPNEKGSPHRDHTPSSSRPQQQHSRFSPEDIIQAETGERGGVRGGDVKSARDSSYTGQSVRTAAGKSRLASVSYDSQPRGGVASHDSQPQSLSERGGGVAGGVGEGEGKDIIQTNQVALRVAQFNQTINQQTDDVVEVVEKDTKPDGGRGRQTDKERVLSPNNDIHSPDLEKAKLVIMSSGSSEEELTSINSENVTEGPDDHTDGVYYPPRGEILPPGGNIESTHPQLSQPAYLSKTPPSSSSSKQASFPHNPASYPSLSQPHSYNTPPPPTGHPAPQTGHPAPRSGHTTEVPSSRSIPPSHPHQRHHTHTSHQPHTYHSQQHPHQRSHDHHMTPYTAAIDQQQQQHRGYRQQQGHTPHTHTHQQQQSHTHQWKSEHNMPQISKQNLLRAHEAAALGDPGTLHQMLHNHEVNPLCMDDTGLTLAHTAAMTNNLSVIIMLVNEGGLPLHALQLPDENLVSPAMVAIQNGYVDVLKWLVEEGKVPLVVKDAGGETLLHHAAHHGNVHCLQWLLKVAKPLKADEPLEFLDNFGVTPAHFAAQQGHLECLQLMIDHNYSVVTPDKEGQKPIDWADAMGQTLCVRYLFMHETCWELSAAVAHLNKQLDSLQKENTTLKEKLSTQSQEYHQALGKIQSHHEERLLKIREQYVDLTASLLKDIKDRDGGSAVGGGGASPKIKSSQSVARKDSSRSSRKPPIPPDLTKKRDGGNGEVMGDSVDGGGGGGGGSVGFYRTSTPQEVLERQKNTLTLRMNASRKAREGRNTLVSRAFSPVQYRMNSRQDSSREGGGVGKGNVLRAQRHTEHSGRTPLKVKFSGVNQYIDHSHYGNSNVQGRHGDSSRPNEHGEQQQDSGRKGQSPSHVPSGHPSPGHVPPASLGQSSSGHHSPGHSSGHGGGGIDRGRHDNGVAHWKDNK